MTESPEDHFRHSYTKDKSQLIRRLARIEGQVRGITRMIEREEYCVDILQQTSALRAAVDSLAVLVLEDHVQGCVRTAAANGEHRTQTDGDLAADSKGAGAGSATPGRIGSEIASSRRASTVNGSARSWIAAAARYDAP